MTPSLMVARKSPSASWPSQKRNCLPRMTSVRWVRETSRRYGPLFGAHTLVLARSQEYSADRHSADAVGPTIAANALTAVAVAPGS
jgi:hypothetical protein